jgi:glycosyltransferase involved in cell wall biosynthesis
MLIEQNWNAVPGGTARSVNRLADALIDHTDIDVIGVHGKHRRDPRLALPEALATVEVPIPGRALAESWSRFHRPLLDRWVDVDVVHAPAYVLPKTRRPVVATIHDLAFVRHPEWFTPNGVSYFNRFLDRVRSSDTVVIVPSQATAEDCAAGGIEESRIHVIGWGVDMTEATKEAVARVQERYSLPDRFVLFVGTLEPRKNLSTLAEAMARLPNLPLVVVGPSGWGDVHVPQARLLGDVPDVDIEPLMAAATVLAYPSHFEGFGLPVLEAMAQGTPVVTTAGTAPAEVAGGGGISVNTHSSDELGQAIESLAGSDSDCARLGSAGKVRAAEFRWDETARATAQIYRSLT